MKNEWITGELLNIDETLIKIKNFNKVIQHHTLQQQRHSYENLQSPYPSSTDINILFDINVPLWY